MSSTQVDASELELQSCSLVPTGNSAPSGGGCSGVQITGTTIGDWIASLSAPSSGALDVGFAWQYQAACLVNTNAYAHNFVSGQWWIPQIYVDPTTPGAMNIVSASSLDSATTKIRNWSNVGGSLIVEDIILNGVTAVNGAHTNIRTYRSVALVTSSDVLTVVNGPLTITNAGGGGAIIPTGASWASGEVSFSASATANDTVATANRLDTTHVVDSLTYTRPNSVATALTIPTLPAAGGYGKIWCWEKMQPGMPPVPEVDLYWAAQGSST